MRTTPCRLQHMCHVSYTDSRWIETGRRHQFLTIEFLFLTTPLGKCFDRTIKVVKREYTKGCKNTHLFDGVPGCGVERNIAWKSFNSRTGQGKSCEDYQSQRLCTICERVSSQHSAGLRDAGGQAGGRAGG